MAFPLLLYRRRAADFNIVFANGIWEKNCHIWYRGNCLPVAERWMLWTDCRHNGTKTTRNYVLWESNIGRRSIIEKWDNTNYCGSKSEKLSSYYRTNCGLLSRQWDIVKRVKWKKSDTVVWSKDFERQPVRQNLFCARFPETLQRDWQSWCCQFWCIWYTGYEEGAAPCRCVLHCGSGYGKNRYISDWICREETAGRLV